MSGSSSRKTHRVINRRYTQSTEDASDRIINEYYLEKKFKSIENRLERLFDAVKNIVESHNCHVNDAKIHLLSLNGSENVSQMLQNFVENFESQRRTMKYIESYIYNFDNSRIRDLESQNKEFNTILSEMKDELNNIKHEKIKLENVTSIVSEKLNRYDSSLYDSERSFDYSETMISNFCMPRKSHIIKRPNYWRETVPSRRVISPNFFQQKLDMERKKRSLNTSLPPAATIYTPNESEVQNQDLGQYDRYNLNGYREVSFKYNNDKIINNENSFAKLYEASKNGDFITVKNIVNNNNKAVLLADKRYFYSTPLHYSCMNGHLVITDFLIQSGSQINATNSFIIYFHKAKLPYFMLLKEDILKYVNFLLRMVLTLTLKIHMGTHHYTLLQRIILDPYVLLF